MDKEYFFLDGNCFHEKGAVNSIIYDILNHKAYFIDKKGTQALGYSEKGIPIPDIKTKINVGNIVEDFYDKLKELQLGRYYENRVFIENLKTIIDFKRMESQRIILGAQVSTIVIELNQICGLKCKICSRADVDNNYGFCGCSCWNEELKESDSIHINKVKRTITDLMIFKPNEILIIGGDPFLSENKLGELIRFARELGIPIISVYTNATEIKRNHLSLLRNYDVNIRIPIFGFDVKSHNVLSGVAGSYEKTINNLELLLDHGVKVYPIIYNDIRFGEKRDEISELLVNIGFKNICKEYIYPGLRTTSEKGKRYFELCDQNVNVKDDIDTYILCKSANPCLYGKLAITLRGDVLPCQNARNHIVGNIYSEVPTSEIIKKGLLDIFWFLSKENIDTCRDCEFRFACRDCLIYCHEFKNPNFGKNCFCTYSPSSQLD